MKKHFLLFALGLMMMALGVQTTQADDFTFPENTIWSEGFESDAMPEGWTSVLNGWTIGYGDYRGYSAFAENIPPHSGNYNLRRLPTNRGDVDTLYLSTLDLSGYTGLYFHCFFMNAAWGNDTDYLEVFYRSAPDASWISLFGLIQNSSSEWAELGAPLEASNTATCQLAFVVHDNLGYGVAIDDIYITGERTGTDPIIIEEDGWAHYDNGTYSDGICANGTDLFYWGIRIPAGSVTSSYLDKVGLVCGNSGELTLHIYEGGETPARGILKHSQSVQVEGSENFQVFLLNPSLAIDPDKDLWIVFENDKGVNYPAGYSVSHNAPDARWISLDGIQWSDVVDYKSDWIDRAWMIRGHFAESTGIEEIYEGHMYDVRSQKILHEGHLFILRDGKLFNAQGARVR